MTDLLVTNKLTKKFKDQTVLDRINMPVSYTHLTLPTTSRQNYVDENFNGNCFCY